VYARFERAEAAHANGLENAPLFIGAVLAGNVAGLESCEFDSVFLCCSSSLKLPGVLLCRLLVWCEEREKMLTGLLTTQLL
jgi:uncharacterized MAPEG superfamily protein